MIWRNVLILILLFVPAVITATDSYSQDEVAETESMKGVGGVGIRIDEVDPKAAADGLSKDKILSAVSNELKKAGIKVLSSAETAAAKGKPTLFVSINTIKHPGDVYSFTVSVSLDQLVMLVRNQKIQLMSPTWTVLGTGASIPENLGSDVEKYVQLMVQKFIDDFKEANPK
jgi:hypothetical protein